MNKIYLSIALIIICGHCFSQQNTSDKQIMDSLIKNDDFLSDLNSLDNSSSYVKLNVGIGNKLFSEKNNSLNALDQNKSLVFSPSIEYFNRTGFGLLAAGFLVNNNNKAGFYQYALTPSYDYLTGKKIDAGISFTKFFIKDKYSNVSSPIQNDLYIYANLKKPWLRPGLSFGYSAGNENEINFIDTTVIMQNRSVRIQSADTVTTKINTVSFSATLSHTFSAYDILKTDDALVFVPQLSLNTGSNKYNVTHESSLKVYRPFKKITKTRIRNFAEKSTPPVFQVESIGWDMDVSYTIGKFIFEPEIYLDYYLPATNEKRFTQVFSFNVGYTF